MHSFSHRYARVVYTILHSRSRAGEKSKGIKCFFSANKSSSSVVNGCRITELIEKFLKTELLPIVENLDKQTLQDFTANNTSLFFS